MKDLIIIGAGGHARPVIDVALLNGYKIIGIIDLDYSGVAEKVLGAEVLGGIDILQNYSQKNVSVFIAIGDNHKRKIITERVESQGFNIPTLIHHTAILSKFTNVGNGTFINAGAIINAKSNIGAGVIINTGAIIDHETTIESFVHVAPGVSISGRVSVGKCTFIGVGSSIIDKVNIGENVIIGAGSVIIKDIESNTRVVGISRILS